MLEAALAGLHVELGGIRGQVLRVHIESTRCRVAVARYVFALYCTWSARRRRFSILDFNLAVGEK